MADLLFGLEYDGHNLGDIRKCKEFGHFNFLEEPEVVALAGGQVPMLGIEFLCTILVHVGWVEAILKVVTKHEYLNFTDLVFLECL